MNNQLKPLIGQLTIFAKKRMGFQHPPRLFLRSDSDNSQKMLGKTAHYDPQEKSVTLFTHKRHPKDILRSYAHELVHHTQNLRGDLSSEKCGEMGTGYAQNNEHMRNMEKEAYLQGNMCFRDWEDSLSNKDKYIIMKIAESTSSKEKKTMTTTTTTREILKETIRKVLSEQSPPRWATSTIAQAEKGNSGITQNDLAKAKAAVAAAAEAGNQSARAEKEKKSSARAAAISKKKAADARFDTNIKLNKGLKNSMADFDKKIKDAGRLEVKAAQAAIDSYKRGNKGITKSDAEKAQETINNPNAQVAQLRKQKEEAKQWFSTMMAKMKSSNDANELVAIGKLEIGEKLPGGQTNVDSALAATEPTMGLNTSGDSYFDPRGLDPDRFSALDVDEPVKISRRELIRKGRQQSRILTRRNMVLSVGDIKTLQRRLVNLGYMKALTPSRKNSIDGMYGQMTYDAIVKLQNAAGIEGDAADGVAGPATVRAIRKKPALMNRFKAAATKRVNESKSIKKENNTMDKTNEISMGHDMMAKEAEELARDRKQANILKQLSALLADGQVTPEQLRDMAAALEDKGAPSPKASDQQNQGVPVDMQPRRYIDDLPPNYMEENSVQEDLGDGVIDPDDDTKGKIPGADPKTVSRGDVAADAKARSGNSDVNTPEKEKKLNESRFTDRNNRLFENLINKWTK